MKKEWKNPLLYLFSMSWRHSDNKVKVACFWTIFVITELLETFAYPLIPATLINIIQKEGIHPENLNKLFIITCLFVVFTLVFWALHGPGRIMEVNNSSRITMSYLNTLIKGVVTLPIEWHVDHHSGDTIDKVEKGSKALKSFSESTFTLIYAFVRLVGSYCMLVYFSHPAAYIVFIMMVIGIFISTRLDKIIVAQYTSLNKAENKISESIFDAISNITTVIILRVEKLVLTAISKEINAPYDLQVKNTKINEIKWFLVNVCCSIMTFLVLSVYFWQASRDATPVLIGSVFLLMRYLDKISDLFFQFTSQYGDILKERARVANSELLSKDFVEKSLTNHVLHEDWKKLLIEYLTFAYKGDKHGRLHLNNISLEIERGQKIALVGIRGSGKTTFLKVMRDLYTPQSLKLSADGVEIPHGFDGISRAIALIPQSPEVFATTIRKNITFGAEVSDKEIKKFTDIACFTDVIEGLPKGLESSTKERGVNLSGGQQQGLALARGLLASKDKEIILLDEPTSSLDKATENEVYRNIFKSFPEKTIISTVHGLHLLPMFDIIYVFNNGEIVGRGTVSQLLENCPKFKKLWVAMRSVELIEKELIENGN